MPATVKRLPDERILIATLTGQITIEDILQVYKDSHDLIGDEPGIFYRITDTTEATSSFVDMMKMLQAATQDNPYSTQAENIRVTFVGSTHWITFIRNAFQKRGVEIAAFPDMESALESVRFQIGEASLK